MRLKTPIVKIGKIRIGGENPIAIQSMTDTDTADVHATAAQCMELADAGSEILRITVNNEEAARAVPEIRKILDENGYENLPLVGDFHYNGHKLLKDFPEMATSLDKYRINPGNDKNFSEFIEAAVENDKGIRIGVNFGSLDQELLDKDPVEAMVQSAIESAELAEELGLPQNRIVLSVKMSELQDMVAAYKLLAERMKAKEHYYAIHLGLTEAGSGMQGIVSSSAALAILLQEGIGDTIRISITPKSGASRTEEVIACKNLLQSMGLRTFHAKVTSCPGCGRTNSGYFKELAQEIEEYLADKHPDVKDLKVAVMGCMVNGPGESRNADIAIHLPGRTEEKMAQVYVDGKYYKTLSGNNISEGFKKILEDYLINRK